MLVALVVGCGSDDEPAVDGGVGDVDAEIAVDAGNACPRTPGAADGVRSVVISHPFDAGGGQAGMYEVLALSAAGELSQTGHTFEMGRASGGEIAFTPDGQVGVIAQSDGTLGVFTLEAGVPTVVHAAFPGSFYAASVMADPRGDRVWVLDTQFRENGGGVYEVAVGCDGALAETGRRIDGKLVAAVLPLDDGRAVAVGHDILDSPTPRDVHLVDWPAATTVLHSMDAFADEDAIVSSAALTPDDAYVLIADNSAFSAVPNRVAAVAITDVLTPMQTLAPIEDPYDVVTSPFGDAALVVSGFGDAFFAIDYDSSNTTAPFSVRGELAYVGASPQLPGNAVMIERGSLDGLVLVAENVGVRRVQFGVDAAVDDLGMFSLGSGLDVIVGAIGVQP